MTVHRRVMLKVAAAVIGYVFGAGLWLAIVQITGTTEERHWISWREYPQGARTAAFFLAGPLGALAGIAIVSRALAGASAEDE